MNSLSNIKEEVMCIHQRIRTKNYIKYVYCLKKKEEVTYKICSNCKSRDYKKVKVIKKKSSKLAKLERNRFSILTNDLEHCYICTERGIKNIFKQDLHEVYGGSNRKRSIENGLVVPLCRKCHEDKETLEYLKRIVQLKYEKTHSREDFIKIIGKSYL